MKEIKEILEQKDKKGYKLAHYMAGLGYIQTMNYMKEFKCDPNI